MKTEMFATVSEAALETVAGGLFDTLNGSLNNNCINILSNLGLSITTGDIGSNNANVLNEVNGGV